MRKEALIVLAGLGCVGLCGCASKKNAATTAPEVVKSAEADKAVGGKTTATAIARDKSGKIIAANSRCPLMNEHPVRPSTSEDAVRVWRGKTVGFCCLDCAEGWDAMGEKERDEALAVVMKTPGK